MPIYEYKAVDGGQKKKKGLVDADSPREARLKLRRDNLFVTDLSETRRKQRKLIQIKGVTAADAPNKQRNEQVAAVTRQMAALLDAGIPLAEALRMVIEQSPDKKIEAVFRDIREKVSQGITLGDAVSQHPAYFSELYSNMVRAGESSGALDQVMSRLARFLASQARMRNKVGAAMIYPIILMSVGLIVILGLMTFVIPNITKLIAKKGENLPLPTEIMVSTSEFLQNNWFLVAVGALIAAVAFQTFVNSKKGRWIWDGMKLKLPIFGDLIRKQAVSRFSITLATLLRTGVPALAGLEITKKVLNNVVLADALQSVHDHVLEGTDISTPMKLTGMFPPQVCYMVGVGEQAGNLEEMLERVAESYEEEVEMATVKLTQALEPIIIVFLAGMVGAIVLAIVLPLLQLQGGR